MRKRPVAPIYPVFLTLRTTGRQSRIRVACSCLGMAESEGSGDVQFFEGVEKLLEIWFTRTDGNTKQCDLRSIPRQKLESLLKIVRCEVISFVRNDQVDAYVLSESSMFVARRRFILKTCGTTTPLQCLKPLILLVEQYAGFDEVEDVFYSRKNFKRPELQMSPHQAFEQEVALLDTFFKDGAAYCLGTLNHDCWYLYTLNPAEGDMKKRHRGIPEPDQTLEILMSDLDPEVMSIFMREESSSAAEATQKSGIEKLIPNMMIDDFLFEPCGYSMNGISNKNGCYMTIHVTPEPDFSYVSFESNVPQASYKDMISRVLETFQPGKFVITVFANKNVLGNWRRHLHLEIGCVVIFSTAVSRITTSLMLFTPNSQAEGPQWPVAWMEVTHSSLGAF